MNIERLLIYTFIVTALYDVILRKMCLNYDKLPQFFKKKKFIQYLIPYFKKHTLLAAALIAGFVGFGAQFIILNIQKYPNVKTLNSKEVFTFMLLTFVISALYGLPMQASKLFPHLDATYYKNLGLVGGMLHDGYSGLIVQFTVYVSLYLFNKLSL